MAKMIHTMVRVTNAEQSIKFYHALFNLHEKRRLTFDDFTLIYLGNEDSDFELELTHNHAQKNQYELGNGYGHLAFTTPDLNSLHQLAIELGYQPKEIKQFFNHSTLIATFFFITDPDGYDIEVIERSKIYR
ncbi:VOC family protein [Pseudoalteromonas sp. MMG013]|uniref:VOC family protein n=1 Tax=unclassified Pseudoalteromonas TaxID=194690 RepID=UPI001B3645C0|nr:MULTISPECIES: VOC family protein [unclassified Pseudoalteromonas]MBQ4847480.1 VOC family protein [Pseudoalteromonas sp. MMG005]MBQ4861608.1 VOC family protein [Pseudoalteromonas sp. MMG013]